MPVDDGGCDSFRGGTVGRIIEDEDREARGLSGSAQRQQGPVGTIIMHLAMHVRV